VVIDLWPRTAAGGWDRAGYFWAMGGTLALQALVILWAWRLFSMWKGERA